MALGLFNVVFKISCFRILKIPHIWNFIYVPVYIMLEYGW